MELIASEPAVRSPISAAIDENGNLYVTEMIDYPYYPKPGDKPLGTVRLLRDTDGDGRYDTSDVFADHLLWAGGVACWKGGVFVAAPPDIWYFKDTDGDHKADIKRKVFTGFGTKSQQYMLNNLKWGLDHKIYGSTAGNGGEIRPGDRPNEQADFGRSPRLPVRSGHGGVRADRRHDPVRQLVRRLGQPLHVRRVGAALPVDRRPALPGPQSVSSRRARRVQHRAAAACPSSASARSSAGGTSAPAAASRTAIASRCSAGVSHHVIDAGAGVTIYRGNAYPKSFYGNAVIGDAQNNLVHRMLLTPDGVTFRERRADPGTEFVRSSDNWFRPVNFVNAPDGTLYCLDMSREILESIHIPFDVLKFIDLKAGRDSGRLYRIAPDGFHFPGEPHLGSATHGRAGRGCWSIPTAGTATRPIGCSLNGRTSRPSRCSRRSCAKARCPKRAWRAVVARRDCRRLETADLQVALGDAHPALREHAVRLSELRSEGRSGDPGKSRSRWPTTRSRACGCRSPIRSAKRKTRGPSMPSRDRPPRRGRSVDSHGRAQLGRRDVARTVDPPVVRPDLRRVEHGCRNGREAGVHHGRPQSARRDRQAARRGGRPPAIRRTPRCRRKSCRAIGDGLKQVNAFLSPAAVPSGAGDRLLRTLLEKSKQTAADSRQWDGERIAAIRLLACFPRAASGATLTDLLSPASPEGVETTAVAALAGYSDDDIAAVLLDRWKESTPGVRLEIVRALLSREPWTLAYLRLAETDPSAAAPLKPLERTRLLEHKNAAIRDLGQNGPRPASGQSPLGGHRRVQIVPVAQGEGRRPGGRFTSASARSAIRSGRPVTRSGRASPPRSNAREPEALLTHVLDPNFYIPPQYVQYVAVDRNGRTYTGILAEQTSTSISLKREKDAVDTLLAVEHRGAVEHRQVADARRLREETHQARHGRPDRLPANGAGHRPGCRTASGHRHKARADGTMNNELRTQTTRSMDGKAASAHLQTCRRRPLCGGTARFGTARGLEAETVEFLKDVAPRAERGEKE